MSPWEKKKMLIAKRGNPSRPLEALLTSVKALVNLLTKPPPKQWRDSVKFSITQPRSLMIEPALCAHTVLTVGKGPALVVGFEGYMQYDVPRRAQVLNYYATGLQRKRRSVLLKKVSDQAVLGKLDEWKIKKTALFEQLKCLQFDSKPLPEEPPRGNYLVSKKKKRMLNIGRCRKRVQRRRVEKEG